MVNDSAIEQGGTVMEEVEVWFELRRNRIGLRL